MPGCMTSTAAKVFQQQGMTEIWVNGHSILKFSPTESWGGEKTEGQGWSCAGTAALHQQGHFWVAWAWHRALPESSSGIPAFHQYFWLQSELNCLKSLWMHCCAASAGRQSTALSLRHCPLWLGLLWISTVVWRTSSALQANKEPFEFFQNENSVCRWEETNENQITS